MSTIDQDINGTIHRDPLQGEDRYGDRNGSHDQSRDLHRDGDRNTQRRNSGGYFQRSDSDDPNKSGSAKIPNHLLNEVRAERQRIEGHMPKQRSLDFYHAWVFTKGLEALRAVQPVQDPLA